MAVEWVPTETVTPYPGNPRKHQPVEEVADSIERVGWVQPIVVDKQRVIIIGDTRYRAARLRGMAEIPVYVHKGLTEAQARALRVADNRLGERAAWDKAGLLGELEAALESGLVSSTGFDEGEIATLQAQLSGKRERPDVPFSEEIGEANNYVVLVFRTEVDWIAAREHFDLGSAYSKRQNGKPWAKGIGRVIDGAEYLDRISGD